MRGNRNQTLDLIPTPYTGQMLYPLSYWETGGELGQIYIPLTWSLPSLIISSEYADFNVKK